MKKRRMFVVILVIAMLMMPSANVFAYEYIYEARLAALNVFPHSNLEEGPVVSEDEFYGELLDPDYNADIADIVQTYQSGDLEGAKQKWHHYVVNREDDLLNLADVVPVEDLTSSDINYALADRWLNRTHLKGGYRYSFLPDLIDWNYNPTYFDENVPIDYGWLWILNGHTGWSQMARASAMENGDPYGEELAIQVESWIRTQIPGINSVDQSFHDGERAFINYGNALQNKVSTEESPFTSWSMVGDSGQSLDGVTDSWRTIDTGSRLNQWVDMIYYFKHSDYYTVELNDLITRSIVDQVTWLGFPHHYSQGHNWGSYEANGMLQATTFFPEVKVNQELAELAALRLSSDLDGQILPDGTLNELSLTYHIDVLEKYTGFIMAVRAGKLQGERWESLEESIERQYDAIMGIIAPNGGMPSGNEGTVGRTAGNSITERIFSVAVELFPEREDFKWIATNGSEGVRPDSNFYHLSNAGYITMRSGWDPSDEYIHFEAGPVGVTLYHSFQNKLDVQLHSDGYPLLVSAGKHVYDRSAMRWYVTNTRGANSGLVDGWGQARQTRVPMNILRRPAEYFYYHDNGISFASATYDDSYGSAGYGIVLERANLDVKHTRSVLHLENEYAIIVDDFAAHDGSEHEYELLYHTPIGYYNVSQPAVVTEVNGLGNGMNWTIGSAEGTMKGASSANFQSNIVEGLNPANINLGAEIDGRGREAEMRGWLENNIPTPTQQYIVNGKDVRFFTVISTSKKPEDFEVDVINDGQELEITLGDGTKSRISVDITGSHPSVNIDQDNENIHFTAQSNHLIEEAAEVNVGTIKERLLELKDEGAFANDASFRSLQLHLTVVGHFENQGELAKVLAHMGGFMMILDDQKANDSITNDAYQALKADTNVLINDLQLMLN